MSAPAAPIQPQPGLADIPTVVGTVRNAGVEVTLDVQGAPRPLAAGQDLAAFRIIQEALTNTLRHAHAHHAMITVRYGAGELEIGVIDDGRGRDAATDTGRGLVGMAERVALYGGRLQAGNRQDGHGFEVRATLQHDENNP